MKNFFAVGLGAMPLFVTSAALAQSGSMMNGSMGGGGVHRTGACTCIGQGGNRQGNDRAKCGHGELLRGCGSRVDPERRG